MPGKTRQYRFWILTIPYGLWQPPTITPDGFDFLKGQAEVGVGGYHHWQFVVAFTKQLSLTAAKRHFPAESHLEPSRSSAANDYVCKDETAVPGSQFELGQLPFRRNSKTDWAVVLEKAKENKLNEIDGDVLIRNYGNLKKIAFDHSKPVHRGVQKVNVYWGDTGTGKTKRVFEECLEDYYIKSSSTKWWDGYTGQENIIIDEFTGLVGLEHMLKWLDRYPCSAEIKGGQVYLKTKTFWITSNIAPKDWYPNATEEQIRALFRRLNNVVHYLSPRSILNKPLVI